MDTKRCATWWRTFCSLIRLVGVPLNTKTVQKHEPFRSAQGTTFFLPCLNGTKKYFTIGAVHLWVSTVCVFMGTRGLIALTESKRRLYIPTNVLHREFSTFCTNLNTVEKRSLVSQNTAYKL